MTDKILLNKQPFEISEDDLPCLITYGGHMGGSQLSIGLVVSLFLQGSKILFLTAYPMAKENFLNQINFDQSKICFIDNISDLGKAAKNQVIILESGNEPLFLEAIKFLPDLSERVVLVKNIEVFSEKFLNECFGLEKIILSGDIDICVAKDKILKKKLKTIIAFNQPKTSISLMVPILDKWTGYLKNENKSGIIEIQRN